MNITKTIQDAIKEEKVFSTEFLDLLKEYLSPKEIESIESQHNEYMRLFRVNSAPEFAEPVHYQDIYLHEDDLDISFDEERHRYYVDTDSSGTTNSQPLKMSSTEFCKTYLFDEFRPFEKLEKMQFKDDQYDESYEELIATFLRWQFAGKYGSLFHFVMEHFMLYFFRCQHTECRPAYVSPEYTVNAMRYQSAQLLKKNINSQMLCVDDKFLPYYNCRLRFKLFKAYKRWLSDYDNVNQVIKMKHKQFLLSSNKIELTDKLIDFFIDSPKYSKKKLLNRTVSMLVDHHIERIERDVLHDRLRNSLNLVDKFLLPCLPTDTLFDYRAEYMVFDLKGQLGGMVDLIARDPTDPNKIVLFDWKTNEKLMSGFTSKVYNYKSPFTHYTTLQGYHCQLHTYEKIICEKNKILDIRSYLINITSENCTLYSIPDHNKCPCKGYFERHREQVDKDATKNHINTHQEKRLKLTE